MEKKKNVIRETDAEAVRLAKTLIRTARFGALAVLDPENGAPVASRVGVATDVDGGPLILISMLSAHTGALLADARCSLLVGEPGKGDPLTYPRMAISCTGVRLQAGTPEQERARRRYLNRHPKANLYAGFSDFFFLRLEPLRASLIGGFGKAYLLDRPDLLVTDTAAVLSLAEAEQAAIVHMNEEHRELIGIYAKAFIGAGGDGWKITGIDPDGLDLASGSAIGRVFFQEPLIDAGDLQKILVDLAASGRRVLSEKRA